MARYVWRLAVLVLFVAALISETLTPAGSSQAALAAALDGRHVDVAMLDGAVDPLTAQYLTRAIDTATNDGAEALIIQMDTPGGLDSSMRKIISKMLASPVPVVVYVSPSGARAASAGVFLTMASHVAAMAPSTNIGSAHPVSSEGQDIQGDMRDKVTNDAVAYIRTIAEKRGRNADWAEQAVRNSVNITEQQAIESNVVEILATDVRDLLNKLDGRVVTTSSGTAPLKTSGAAIEQVGMSLPERFLHTITNPTLAYLLLTIGIWALIAEFNNPGAILPGVTGAICLILAFIAFESLPLNWGGVALILLSVVLFIAEVKAPTHGILTAGGIVAFVLGSLILFSPFTPSVPSMPTNVSVPWPWIAIMTVLGAIVFTVAVGAGIRAQRARVTVGVDTTMGAIGLAKTNLTPQGVVLLQAEEWTAVTIGEYVPAGARVQVVGRDGLTLKVKGPV
jgi:membrane-bound serine protease (ClpP class)